MASWRDSYLGGSGHLACMAEFLRLGYNVAIPQVDVGDDIFVVDDRDGQLFRVQVKTSLPKKGKTLVGHYFVSRNQLRQVRRTELYYAFALVLPVGFEFVVLPREDLLKIRVRFEKTQKRGARADTLNLRLTFTDGDVSGWGQSFSPYLRAFSRYFPPRAT